MSTQAWVDPAIHGAHLAAWRRAFGAFGAKPSKYPCSAEALAARVLKGQPLPRFNRLVDEPTIWHGHPTATTGAAPGSGGTRPLSTSSGDAFRCAWKWAPDPL